MLSIVRVLPRDGFLTTITDNIKIEVAKLIVEWVSLKVRAVANGISNITIILTTR